MADNLNQSPLAPAAPVAALTPVATTSGPLATMPGTQAPAAAVQTPPVQDIAGSAPIGTQAEPRESLPAYSNQRSGIAVPAQIIGQSGEQPPGQQPGQQRPQQSGQQSGQQPSQQQAQLSPQTPNIPELAPVGPSFFGYKAPKWASDFEHVRNNQGKGSEHDSDTWLVTMIDRLLKKHSL